MDYKGHGREQTEVLSLYFSGGTEQNHELFNIGCIAGETLTGHFPVALPTELTC